MKNKDHRFVTVSKEGSSFTDDGLRQVIVDKETGIHYLVFKSGYGLGITPLLDKDGKTITAKI